MTSIIPFKMQDEYKNRILNFITGNENVDDFESWIYSDLNLESKVGTELYFELIQINYKDRQVLDNLKTIILNNYVPLKDFENFKYIKILQNSGWYQNRSINVNFSNFPDTSEVKNAVEILEEFGGLKFISPERKGDWTLTLVEFFDAPSSIKTMRRYGLNKELVSFAEAHNGHIDLYVDENNRFYKLDNVISEKLYEYKGLDFEHMMRELLELEKLDNFHEFKNNC